MQTDLIEPGTLSNRDQYQNIVKEFLNEQDLTASSKRVYHYSLKQFGKFLEERDFPEITKKLLIEYKESLMDKKADTIKHYIWALRSFFKWMDSKIGLYHFIPMVEAVKLPRVSSTNKKDPLTPGQIAGILKSIDTSKVVGKRNYAIILLMATAGLRECEIASADVSDLGNLFGEEVIFVKSKGHHDKDEYVKIGEITGKAIRNYLATRKDLKASDPLFVGESNYNYGERLTSKGLSKIIRKILNKNGFPPGGRISPYSLRHSCATIALATATSNPGNSLMEIQQVLRHQDIRTSMAYISPLNRMNNTTEYRVDEEIKRELED